MNRGQSSVVGTALLVGLTIAMAGTIVVIGEPLLADSRDSVRADQAEQSMTQLDSRASTVTLGDSPVQQVRLGNGGEGRVRIAEEAGAIEVLVVDETGSTKIVDEEFGAVLYEAGGATIAYQGGGVWRTDGGGSVMVSPPEYRYDDSTLTFPIVQVTGDGWTGSPDTPLQLRPGGFERLFPTDTEGNPLEEGHVHVKVTSEYHRGWREYFETRTEGVVTHDPSNDQVTVNLTVPHTETFDDPLVVTANDSVEGRCDGFPDCRYGDRPSASKKVDERIDECERGGCRGGLTGGSLENGTYYEDGDVVVPETTYDTSEGDISIVVDGDLEFGGSGGGRPGTVNHHQISGGGTVTFYVTGDVSTGGQTGVNTGGDPSDLRVLVHSDGDEVRFHGTPQFTGLLYAPNTDLKLDGVGATDSVIGAAVVRTASGTGNIEYQRTSDVELAFEPIDTITFLHITKNEVRVEAG